MRIACACLLAVTGVAHSQPPAAIDATPEPPGEPSSANEQAPFTYTFGADAQLAFGNLVDWRLTGRFELGVASDHAIVLRAGVGQRAWWETEIDDPTYREIVSRLGYRFSWRRLFAGGELGKSWFKPHYPPEEQMGRNPQWFSDLTLTALVGVRVGRVRLSLDYNYDFTSPVRQIGVQLGVDIVTL